MARKNQVFNSFKRQKLLRKEIPANEALAGLLCLAAIVVAGVWVALQRENYDPSERDISMETLERDSVEDTLYKTPLKRWQDPAQAASASGSRTIDVSPFPPAVVSDGWVAAGRVETFDPDNLYEKINGQAEQYLKFGFVALNVLTLNGREAELDLFLYDQASFANCLGLYEAQRNDKPVEQAGPVLYTPTSLGAFGMVGRYFFHLIGSAEGGAVAAKTQQLLASFAALDSGGDTPQPFVILRDALAVPLARVSYEPINVFQYKFFERVWFARMGDEAAQVFVHQADDPDQAEALLGKLIEAQEEIWRPVEGEPGLLQHQFLKTYFAADREGSTVFGVNDFAEANQALLTLERVRTALNPSGGDGGEEGY